MFDRAQYSIFSSRHAHLSTSINSSLISLVNKHQCSHCQSYALIFIDNGDSFSPVGLLAREQQNSPPVRFNNYGALRLYVSSTAPQNKLLLQLWDLQPLGFSWPSWAARLQQIIESQFNRVITKTLRVWMISFIKLTRPNINDNDLNLWQQQRRWSNDFALNYFIELANTEMLTLQIHPH